MRLPTTTVLWGEFCSVHLIPFYCGVSSGSRHRILETEASIVTRLRCPNSSRSIHSPCSHSFSFLLQSRPPTGINSAYFDTRGSFAPSNLHGTKDTLRHTKDTLLGSTIRSSRMTPHPPPSETLETYPSPLERVQRLEVRSLLYNASF